MPKCTKGLEQEPRPRRRRWKRRWLWAIVALPMLYVGSYVVLSATGGWVICESGEIRIAGLAVADVSLWQPRYGHCERFHSIGGAYVLRSDELGTFYAPLILLDQRYVHRTICFLTDEGELSVPYQPPPASEFHPLQANRFHGRNRH